MFCLCNISIDQYYTNKFGYIPIGLHCENHGMVGNYMYDSDTGKTFLIGTNKDQSNPVFWDDGEPLWVTAEKQVNIKPCTLLSLPTMKFKSTS